MAALEPDARIDAEIPVLHRVALRRPDIGGFDSVRGTGSNRRAETDYEYASIPPALRQLMRTLVGYDHAQGVRVSPSMT